MGENASIIEWSVEPFNEPVGTGWTSTDAQEGMRVFTSDGSQNTIIKDLGAAMASNGTSAYTSLQPLMSPRSAALSTTTAAMTVLHNPIFPSGMHTRMDRVTPIAPPPTQTSV